MEIKMQSIHMNRVKCRNALRLTVDDDVNVTDHKPDVRAVIWKTGNVRLNEKIKDMLNTSENQKLNILFIAWNLE